MMDNQRSEFSAADSALGYIYQCRYALLLSIQRLPFGDPFQVSIETLDDVVFQKIGDPVELLQMKHHNSARQANLTDGSPDLWKTLRNWIELSAKGEIPPDTIFFLITTANVPDGSAASYLGYHSRNEEAALQRLQQTALASVSQDNNSGYKAFLGIPEDRRRALLSAITIIGSSSTVKAIEQNLRNEIFYAVKSKDLEAFLTRLEGWWFRRVIEHLSKKSPTPIISEDIRGQIDELREQFKTESLPIDEEILSMEWDETTAKDSVFVHQLHLISIGQIRIRAAVRDYYRAYEQRSRWLRDKLLYLGELHSYEKRLIEEWELQFGRLTDELGPTAAEEAKKKAAQEVYSWVETNVIAIRSNVTREFICRGSFHLLADDLRVGWHCDFKDRLAHLLERKELAS